MSIKVAISHKTAYKFDRSVKLSPHIFRLRPAAHSRTQIEGYSFKIFPENHFILGNFVCFLAAKVLVDKVLVFTNRFFILIYFDSSTEQI